MLDRRAGHRPGCIDDKGQIAGHARRGVVLLGRRNEHQHREGLAVPLFGKDCGRRFFARGRRPSELKVTIGRHGVFLETDLIAPVGIGDDDDRVKERFHFGDRKTRSQREGQTDGIDRPLTGLLHRRGDARGVRYPVRIQHRA